MLFAISAGPHQRSHSRVRVPWDSVPYSSISDSRLPFLLPPTPRMATVEVFDPASTWDVFRIVLLVNSLDLRWLHADRM
jgi:hypothetical protein